jgi:murein DD-endopeptidase MepM/ murein hydrolase activator NlpD
MGRKIVTGLFLALCAHGAHAQLRSKCGPGAELRVSPSVVMQGDLFRVEIYSTQKIGELTGEWNGHPLVFWRDASAAHPNWRALAGADLEQAPGKAVLHVTRKTADGKALKCTETIEVREGHFATEKLQVGKQFVEPDPQQLERAQAESARLRAIFATVTPEKLWHGRFRMPLAGVHKGGNFGHRRVLNGEPHSPHSGVDFAAPVGTPVRAAQSGRVVLAEGLFFAGNTVVLDHGLGVYTLYGHLSAITVKAGTDVAAGALLGKVGATGRVTGAHLHWGLTVEGARVNAVEIVKLPQ